MPMLFFMMYIVCLIQNEIFCNPSLQGHRHTPLVMCLANSLTFKSFLKCHFLSEEYLNHLI